MCGLWLELVPCLMEIQLLIPEREGATACRELDRRHPERALIKGQRSLDVADGENDVVDRPDLHRWRAHPAATAPCRASGPRGAAGPSGSSGGSKRRSSATSSVSRSDPPTMRNAKTSSTRCQ